MTHTPGPWAHKEQEIFAADGTCICYVRYNGEEGDPESQDTARLIAAAPDLLEALDLILPLAKGYVAIHKVPSTQEWLRAAEAAIAKAKP